MAIRKNRRQVVMSPADIADVYANWKPQAPRRFEDRLTHAIWQHDTCCAHCLGHLAKGSVAVVVDADTDTESVYHSGCAVELVVADNERRGNLRLVK